MDLHTKETDQRKNMQLLFLVAAGIVLFPFVLVDGWFPGMGYFLAEKYMAIPCLLFLGSALCQRLTPSAKKSLLLSILTVLWFVMVQMQHKLVDMNLRNFGVFAVVYLLAFPYAAVTEDGKKALGLKWIGRIYLAFSLLPVVFAGMLLLDAVPEALELIVHWDGVRAVLFWHPNGAACVLMLGIGFSLYFLAQAEKKWEKLLLVLLTALQFGTQILTNSRTTIFLSCALIAATVFFALWKGTWKQAVKAIAAALAVLVLLLLTYSTVFDLHTQAQVNKLLSQTIQQTEETTPAPQETPAAPEAASEPAGQEEQENGTQNLKIDEQTGEVTISGSASSTQGSLEKDMKTLNGRTRIWNAAFTALRDNPKLKIWGTEYYSAEISSRMGVSVVNAHNSWIQMLMQLGIPGLLTALAYTVIAVCNLWVLLWRKNVDISQKIVALLVVCILAASMLESYLFVGEMPTSFVNFAFFLCTGYLVQWNRLSSGKK